MNSVKELVIDATGLDAGNSITKVVAGQKDVRIEVPTIGFKYYEPRERDEHTKVTLEQTYVVTLDSPAVENATWLIGAGVSLESDPTLALKPEPGSIKVDVEVLLATVLVSLARAALERKGLANLPKTRREIPVRFRFLTASLPYTQHKKTYRQSMRAKLTGTHRVHFHDLAGVGEVTVVLTIENVLTYPEGMAAMIAAAHDVRRGNQLVTVRPELLEDTISVLDIGGGTSDLIGLDGGLSLNTGRSDTFTWGINTVLDAALKGKLRGWVEDRAELVSRIRSGNWIVKGRGEIDIRPILNEAGLLAMSENISAIVQREWKNRIRHFFLVGGGASLLRDLIKLPEGYAVETFPDSEWKNVEGNFYASLMALAETEQGNS